MKSARGNLVRCFITTVIILGYASCGEQGPQVSNADFMNYLATGEMKLAGPGANYGDSNCESRVKDKACSGSTTDFRRFGNSREAAAAAAAQSCEAYRQQAQQSAQSLADAEKRKCEEDRNADGTPDCDFLGVISFPACQPGRCEHYIDGGGSNPDTVCWYEHNGTSSCFERDADYLDSSGWYCTSIIRPQCINQISCHL